MKQEMRKQLAQLPFEEKIRKVGELIRLARKVKSPRAREAPGAIRNRLKSLPVLIAVARKRNYP